MQGWKWSLEIACSKSLLKTSGQNCIMLAVSLGKIYIFILGKNMWIKHHVVIAKKFEKNKIKSIEVCTKKQKPQKKKT